MSEEQTFSQREDIIKQLQKLREEANKADVQIKNCIQRRNELNEQVKKTREEINGLKNERDVINEKVKTLKQQRDAIRTQSDPVNEEIKLIREKISELKKTVPRESQRELQEQHDAIEWKISTTSLDLQDEKRLIEDVKQIEILLSSYKKIDTQSGKIKNLLVQRKAFDEQADVFHKELTDLAAKSQSIHQKMMEKVTNMKMSKTQADNQHQIYIKTREEILTPTYVRIAELTGQLNSVKATMAKEAKERAKERAESRNAYEQANMAKQKETKEKEQAIKEKLGAEARNKLQRGEKVSWNEFQLTMNDASEDESKTQD